MADTPKGIEPASVLTGWDFSTSGVKCLAFDLEGRVLARVHLPTDLWYGDPVVEGLRELNLMQLEGQARASVRMMAARLRELGRLRDWAAGGISATHHTAGRIDDDHVQVRRAICWNDQTLTEPHRRGLRRLGGAERVKQLIGGPWAIRYSLSHLVKDEQHLPPEDWRRTARILPHGALAAGYLTGNFDAVSVSAAASTGIMDLRRRRWSPGMLDALESPTYRRLARQQLPKITDHHEPIGALARHVLLDAGMETEHPPMIFPTSDDQQAGLVGGGAVDHGQMAVVLGTSAVVNSSSDRPPAAGDLDLMCLNWGPYLWMQCYNNGAGLLNHVFGKAPDFAALEAQGRDCPAGAGGVTVLPFLDPEPSLKVKAPLVQWMPGEPKSRGKKFRACLEALAYLIAFGVQAHEKAGQTITRITVSGGMARSDLMCEILASVLDRRLERLESDEGPALGAAVTALAAFESYSRHQRGIDGPFTVADAVEKLVKFRKPVDPRPAWTDVYRQGLRAFEKHLREARKSSKP